MANAEVVVVSVAVGAVVAGSSQRPVAGLTREYFSDAGGGGSTVERLGRRFHASACGCRGPIGPP